jgi:DNA primase
MQANRVTPGQLRRALKNFDFLSFLENAGLDAHERNGEISGECPWCHHRRTSFYVKVGVGVFKCHYCHESGWALKLIEKVARCTTMEAITRIMAQRASIYEDTHEYELVEEDEAELEELPPVIELPPGFHLLADSKGETARRYREYALGRMTEAQMVEYGVGFIATGYYRGRIVVPIYYFGSLVNWVARAIKDDAPKKVLTPPGNAQYSYVFNLEKVWNHPSVVITEGVFDCLAMDDIAVATFGKTVTITQVNALVNAGVREIILCWDADAQADIWKTYNYLRMTFDSVKVVSLPAGEDPSSIGRAGMVSWLKEAQVPTEYIEQSRDRLPEVYGVR